MRRKSPHPAPDHVRGHLFSQGEGDNSESPKHHFQTSLLWGGGGVSDKVCYGPTARVAMLPEFKLTYGG